MAEIRIMFDRMSKGIRLPKTRCKGLCEDEASIHGSGYGRYNARCSHCEKALNSDKIRCYCCGMVLRRRRSVNKNLKHKEELVTRI